MPRLALATLAAALLALVAIAPGEPAPRASRPAATVTPIPAPAAPSPPPERSRERPRPRSVALGTPTDGALRNGIRLPAAGRGYVTWDPILRRAPGRGWRRHGTDRLVSLLRRVARGHARAHPDAPPLAIGDLSRPRGGDFGPRYGIVGHASHQNGLDADLYYPRSDGRAEPPLAAAQTDRALTRSLVRRLVRAGAERILVSPSLGLPAHGGVVRPAGGHEDHLHLRVPPAQGAGR